MRSRMFVHLLNADQLKTLRMYSKKLNYACCFKDLYATTVLASMRIPPKRKGAPGNKKGARELVKNANKLVISKGPMMDVTLIRLVRDPCNSPWALAGTLPEMVDCKAGPAIPPRQ